MKKQPYFLLLQLVPLIIASTTIAGGIKPDSFSLSGIIGGYRFDGDQHLQSRPILGIRGGYNFTKYLGMEILFDFVPTKDKLSGRSDVQAYRYGGDLLVHLFPDNNLVPYLAAGYSGITIDRDNQHTLTKGLLDYGPGMKYFLTDNLALRGDFRHLILHDRTALANFEYTVGLTYQFGGKQAVPALAQATMPIAPPVTYHASPVLPPTLPEPIPITEPTPDKMKYCVSLDIEFDINKADIRPQYHDEVAKAGNFMKKYPTTTATIAGYADEVGSDEYNLQLSQRRAESVVKSLGDNFGIDPSRLSAKGYGKALPIADNTSDAGKQKNRRISAIIDCALDIKALDLPPERLCMTLKMEFATDSIEIDPKYFDAVNGVGEYLKTYPTTTATIEGHTDSSGSQEHNMKLSLQRAEQVVQYLVEHFGIKQSRITAKGYGSTRSIAYNNTAEGRQKNRRINAIIDCVSKM